MGPPVDCRQRPLDENVHRRLVATPGPLEKVNGRVGRVRE